MARRPSNLDNNRARAKGSVLVAGASGNCVVMLSLPYQISFLSLVDGLILAEILSQRPLNPKNNQPSSLNLSGQQLYNDVTQSGCHISYYVLFLSARLLMTEMQKAS